MCGRYAASRDTATLVAEFEVSKASGKELAPDYNVAPTKEVYAVVDRAGDDKEPGFRELAVVKWGLVPSWAKDPKIGSKMINARSETLTQKASFRRALAKRRCLLPADGFFEWYETDQSATAGSGKPVKQPFFIHPPDGSVLAMAGLFEYWRNPEKADDDPDLWLWTATVITTTAPDDLGRIHDRAPMIVPAHKWNDWLDPLQQDGAQAVGLLEPAAPGWLVADPVSTRVNNVRNNGPELVVPTPAA